MKACRGLVLITVVAAACAAPAERGEPGSAAPEGTLVGSAIVGPGCPVEIEGEPCGSQPAAGARFVIRGAAGEVIARATAGDDGAFAVSLPPGRYVVELDPRGVELAKELPAEVGIVGGRETRLDVRIDTGMR